MAGECDVANVGMVGGPTCRQRIWIQKGARRSITRRTEVLTETRKEEANPSNGITREVAGSKQG